MTDRNEAIKQLLGSAMHAYSLKREQHAMALLHEVLASAKLIYGETEARSVIFLSIASMPRETQTTWIEMWDRFEQTKRNSEQ